MISYFARIETDKNRYWANSIVVTSVRIHAYSMRSGMTTVPARDVDEHLPEYAE